MRLCPVIAALTVAALSLSSSPARAQTPPDATAVAPDALAEARRRHAAGRSLLEANPPDHNAALAEFQRAYDLLEGHPRRYLELSNIGRCYQGLGQYDRAMEYYERYLREGGAQAEDRAQVEASIAALGDILGTLDVTVNVPQAEVWIDSRRVGTAPGRLRVPGGRHVVELRARGHFPARQEVELASRRSVALTFHMEAPRGGVRPVFFWVTASLAVAAAGTGGVFGGLALAARGDVDTRLASTNADTRFSVGEEDARNIRNLALTADVLYASAVALGIGATVLLVLTDWRGAPRERATAWRGPVVAPFGAGLQLVGAF